MIFWSHLRSNISLRFESSKLIHDFPSNVHWNFSPSRTVSEIIWDKCLMVTSNGGIWLFQTEYHRQIFFNSKKRVLLSPNGVDWRIMRQNRSSRFSDTLITERKRFFLKNKNNEPLYVGYKHIQPGKFSRNHILLDYPGWWHINLAKYFQIGWLRYLRQEVKLSIFSANREYPLRLLLYQNIVISWWFLLDKVGRSDEISRAGLASQSDPVFEIHGSLQFILC